MFKKTRNKNKRGQNTAEYAILIALVVAAVIAMQTYAQRGLHARIRSASRYMRTQTTALGNTLQYEPYYSDSFYEVTKDSTEHKDMSSAIDSVSRDSTSNRVRAKDGRSITDYTHGDETGW